MSKFGIDVSQHNGNINWEEVRNHIDFAILRLGWIGNKNNHTLDTQFERNYNECKRLGIPVGVYVYNYCLSVETVKSGANWTIEKLQGKSLELPVYIDAEDPSEEKLGKRINTDMCIAFNSIIEQSGRWAGVYANRNWFNNFLYKDEIKNRYTTWIATYCAGTNKYEGEYDMWQNSSDGHIDGINGRVDTNYMYRDLIAEIGNTKEIEYKKSIDEIAREVINGQWGNGEDRKKRLQEAGYNYQEVQNKVNEMLNYNNRYYKKCNSNFKSIVDALNSIGVNSSYENRKKIALKNNIINYSGTATQNNQLLEKLKSGKLIKV